MPVPTLLAALGVALVVSGCGIKGPLYTPQIPERPAPAAQPSTSDHSKPDANP